MFTQCPVCKTVFNVKPEHLAVAGGKVRCSRCQSIFNANEHSYSQESSGTTTKPGAKPTAPTASKPPVKQVAAKPSARSTTPPPSKETTAPTATAPPRGKSTPTTASSTGEKPASVEPTTDEWFDLTPSPASKPVTDKKAPSPAMSASQKAPTSPSSASVEPKLPELETSSDEQPPSVEDELNEDLFKLFDTPENTEPAISVAESAKSTDTATEKTAPVEAENRTRDTATTKTERESSGKGDKTNATPEKEPKGGDKSSSGNYSLPPQLVARPVRATMKNLFYAISILLLIASLGVQYAFSHRIPLRENATLRPLLDALCQVTQCPMPPKRDLKKIELVDNMMQSHPRYQNSLLITATLINRADYVQPYPIVEITMTDLQQKVVAQRTFRPEEYLVGDTAEMGFTPNIEVALMLEVADPGNNAVGFKFDFY